MVLYGTEGKIVLPTPHYAGECFLYDKAGNQTEHFKDTETKNGFVYEIEEAVKRSNGIGGLAECVRVYLWLFYRHCF